MGVARIDELYSLPDNTERKRAMNIVSLLWLLLIAFIAWWALNRFVLNRS